MTAISRMRGRDRQIKRAVSGASEAMTRAGMAEGLANAIAAHSKAKAEALRQFATAQRLAAADDFLRAIAGTDDDDYAEGVE